MQPKCIWCHECVQTYWMLHAPASMQAQPLSSIMGVHAAYVMDTEGQHASGAASFEGNKAQRTSSMLGVMAT